MIPLIVAGYVGTSPAMAEEKKCHPQVPFCEPVTIYEEGKDYSSEALEVDDHNAYKQFIVDGDVSYILIKPVNLTRTKYETSLEDAVGLLEPKINSTTRIMLEKGKYKLEATVEGELCGEDKELLGMQIYTNNHHQIVVFYDHNGKEKMALETQDDRSDEILLEDVCNYYNNHKLVK